MKQEQTLAIFGKDYEIKVLKQIIGELHNRGNGIVRDDKFGRKLITKIGVEHFEHKIAQSIIVFIKQYFQKYTKIPFFDTLKGIFQQNFGNDKRISNEFELELYIQYLKDIESVSQDDKEWVRENAVNFINTKNLERAILKSYNETILKGKFEDYPKIAEELMKAIVQANDLSDIEAFVSGDYRHLDEKERIPIPTGIEGLDTVLNGGLARKEFALFIAPSGVGKTTFATYIANNAARLGLNVLQIFFEDTEEQIKMKHIAKMISKPINFSSNKKNRKVVVSESDKKLQKIRDQGGCLVLQPMDSTETTVSDIRNLIIRAKEDGVYFPDTGEKKSVEFDLVLIDYIDCIKPKQRYQQTWEGQTEVTRELEKLAKELNYASWNFTQGTKASLNAKVVTGEQMGGDYGKYKVAHFVMSVAKGLGEFNNKANIAILKNRMGSSGLLFEDCLFDNANMIIEFNDQVQLSKEAVNDVYATNG
jgi:RecA/RadA recombinase